MGCVPAKTCQAALAQASSRWPGRNHSSDGICGDSSHQARKSDHNEGNAFDLTHDPTHGVDSYSIADWLRERVISGNEKRVKYIISNRRIFNPSVSLAWRTYTGSNPHDHHMHVSILSTARDDTHAWWDGYGNRQEEDMFTDEDRALLKQVADTIGKRPAGSTTAYEALTYKTQDGKAHRILDPLRRAVDAIKAKVGA